jgi:hypothetical protein
MNQYIKNVLKYSKHNLKCYPEVGLLGIVLNKFFQSSLCQMYLYFISHQIYLCLELLLDWVSRFPNFHWRMCQLCIM